MDQFQIKNGNQILTYLGAKHSFDPNDSQNDEIRKSWSEFLKATDKQPKVALVEHWPTGNCLDDEQKAIKNEAEVGLTASLAFNAGVGMSCPEPDRSAEFKHLADNFPKKEIAYYYFARAVVQWQRQNTKPEFNRYISSYLDRDKRVSGWSDEIFTLEKITETHKELFASDFDENDGALFKDVINPTQEGTSINKVAKSLHDFRNKKIIENIMRFWKAGNSIFIVYGLGHMENHKQELEARIGFKTNK